MNEQRNIKIFLICALIFLVSMFLLHWRGVKIEENYNFQTDVKEIVIGEKGRFNITVDGYLYILSSAGPYFTPQIEVGDSLIKKKVL